MPRMVLFKRKMAIAADDLYLPTSVMVLFRLVWLPVIAYCTALGCVNDPVSIYMYGNLILSSLCLLGELLTIRLSLAGTIVRPGIRKHLSSISHVYTLLLLADFLWQLAGFITIALPNPCSVNDLYLIKMVNIWAFLIKLLFLIGYAVMVYNFSSSLKGDENSYIRIWQRRLEWIFTDPTYRKRESNQVIADTSKLLADYFKDVDWAPSDIAVGLLLLKREQKLVREATEVSASLQKGQMTQFIGQSTGKASIPKKQSIPKLPDSAYGSNENLKKQTIKKTDSNETLGDIELDVISPEGKMESSEMIHLESEEKQKRRKSSNGKKIEDPDKRRRSIFGGRKRDESESESENKKKKLPKKDDSDSETDKKRRKSLFGGKKDDKRRKSIEEDLPNGVPYNTFPGEEPKKPEERRPSLTFTSALDLAQERPFMVREDIRDVLHFIHYAEMAYVTLDLETESKTDLITHFSPKNDLYRSPYLVCVDHDWKCVVIAVRGTWSLKDVLTDLKLDTVGLDGPEDPKRAHSGILMTAKNIVHDLINDRVLEKLTQENGQAQGYSVVLTGHSLGGAVASLVAYFLRQRQYRRVRCYAFSPPCLLNEACMGYFDQFCMSIVCGDDVISRTNIYTLNEIKKDVERLIQECDTPKYKILGSVISNKFKGQTAKTKALIDRIQNGIQPTSAHPLEHVPKEELKRIRKTTQSLPDLWRGHEQTIIQMTQNEALQQYPLFLPGKILYIEKIRDFAAKYHVQQIHLEYDEQQQQDKSLKKLKQALMDQMEKIKERVKDYKYLYVPRWAEQKEFQYIVISKSMLSDHLPFGILNELEAFPRGKPLVTTS